MPVRPKSIVQFELVYWAIILLGLINTALSWSDMMASVEVQRMIAQVGMASVYVTASIGLGIQLLLWYFIARRGSVIAKWILVVLTVIGLVTSALGLANGDTMTLTAIIGVMLMVLQVVALVLVFRPDTRPWFGEDAGDEAAA